MRRFIRLTRKVVFWLHLAGGVIAGLVIMLMATTGILLSFERQVLEWLDEPKVEQVVAGQAAMPLEELLGKAVGLHPELTLSSVNLKAGDDAGVGVSFGRDKQITLNPYTGGIWVRDHRDCMRRSIG